MFDDDGLAQAPCSQSAVAITLTGVLVAGAGVDRTVTTVSSLRRD
jgi:hypothetical protein